VREGSRRKPHRVSQARRRKDSIRPAHLAKQADLFLVCGWHRGGHIRLCRRRRRFDFRHATGCVHRARRGPCGAGAASVVDAAAASVVATANGRDAHAAAAPDTDDGRGGGGTSSRSKSRSRSRSSRSHSSSRSSSRSRSRSRSRSSSCRSSRSRSRHWYICSGAGPVTCDDSVGRQALDRRCCANGRASAGGYVGAR